MHTVEFQSTESWNAPENQNIDIRNNETATVTGHYYNIADLNIDDSVDMADVSVLSSNWKTSASSVDLNHSGFVDIEDLLIIADKWLEGKTGHSEGLIAHYKFDGSTDDASGNGNHGTAYNTYEYVEGVDGQGIKLIGLGGTGLNGGHVIIPFVPLNEYPEFAISLWVNPQGDTTNSGEAFIVFGAHGPGDPPIGQVVQMFCHLYDGPYGDRQLNMSVGNGSVRIDSDLANKWSHFVISCKQGVMSAYMDGQFVGDSEYALGPMVEKAAIGAHWWSTSSSSNRFIGIIDDVRIYERDISAAEAQSLYQNP